MLATEATALLHGRAAADEAAEAARRTFEEGAIAEALPTIDIPAAELDAGIAVTALFVRAGLASSNGEVRRADRQQCDQRQRQARRRPGPGAVARPTSPPTAS